MGCCAPNGRVNATPARHQLWFEELHGFVEMHRSRRARVLGQQHDRVAYSANEIINLQTRAQGQQREFAGSIVQPAPHT